MGHYSGGYMICLRMQRKLLPNTRPFDQQFNQNKIGRSLFRSCCYQPTAELAKIISQAMRHEANGSLLHILVWFPTVHSRQAPYCTFSAGSLPDRLLRRYGQLNRSSVVKELQTALCPSTRLAISTSSPH